MACNNSGCMLSSQTHRMIVYLIAVLNGQIVSRVSIPGCLMYDVFEKCFSSCQKKDLMPKGWQWFGCAQSEISQSKVICKHCHTMVSTSRGNTVIKNNQEESFTRSVHLYLTMLWNIKRLSLTDTLKHLGETPR